MAFSTGRRSFLSIALPLLSLVSGGTGARLADADARRVESLTVEVIGMSIAGLAYQRQAEISRTGAGYTVKYWRTGGGLLPGRRDLSTSPPECVRAVEAGNDSLREFMAQLEGLQDGGEAAKCCDHPWMEITFRYRSGAAVDITVGEDLLRREHLASATRCFTDAARERDD